MILDQEKERSELNMRCINWWSIAVCRR